MYPQPKVDVKFHYQEAGLTVRHITLLALLMACGFIVVGQLYVTIPLVEDIAFRFGVDPAQASLVGTAFGITYAAGFLLFGPLSDRYGRKRIILSGLAATALTTVLAGTAASFEFLLASRVMQGLAAALFPPAALSLVTEELPPQHRPLGVSLMSFAFLGAAPLAQLFVVQTGGGFATVMFKLAPLYLLGAIGLCFAAAAHGAISEVRSKASPTGVLLRDPGTIAAWVAATTVLFSFVSFYSGMQVLGTQVGVDLQVLRFAGLPLLLLAFVAVAVTRRYGAPVTARIGMILMALAFGVAILASPSSLIFASAVLAGGVAFAVPGLIATVADRATVANRGRALAIYSFALFFGASVAPPIAQILAATETVLLWLLPAVLLLAAVSGLTICLRSHRLAPN